jgi:hypothetical protein
MQTQANKVFLKSPKKGTFESADMVLAAGGNELD